MDSQITVVALLSGWSSGSTAVAGFLDRCGAYTCPPHQTTNDSRTPLAYEPVAYRNALRAVIDEQTLKPKGDSAQFKAFLKPWLTQEMARAAAAGASHIALKHPLQAFLLPVIEQLVTPRYVLITRPLEDIERTRQRRNWGPAYGKAGAEAIYQGTQAYLQQTGRGYLALAYAEFRAQATARSALLSYIGLQPTQSALAEAEAWVR